MGLDRPGSNRNQQPTAGVTQWRDAPPDGGWGWVVAFGAAIIYLISFGITVSGGIIMVGVMRDIFPSGRSEMAWMPIICNAIARICAPVSTLLSRRFTHRVVVVTGGLLMATGLGLCYQAQSTTQLLLTYGLIVGIGASFTIFPTLILTTLYFEQHVSLANGLTTGGASIGCVCVPLLTEFLLQNYGVRITFMLLSAIALHICAAAALFQPVAWHYKRVKLEQDMTEVTSGQGKYKSSQALHITASREEVDRQLAYSPVALTRFTLRQSSIRLVSLSSLLRGPRATANIPGSKVICKRRLAVNGSPSPKSQLGAYPNPVVEDTISPSSVNYNRQENHASQMSVLHGMSRKSPSIQPAPLPEISVSNVPPAHMDADGHYTPNFAEDAVTTSRQSSVVANSSYYDCRDSRRASKISQTILNGLKRASLPTSSATEKIPTPHLTLAADREAYHLRNGSRNPTEQDEDGITTKRADGANFDFFKNPYFYMMSLTSSAIFFSLCSFPIMVPDFALEEVGEGVSFTQAALLLSAAALSDLVSRSSLSWLWDMPCVNRQYCYMTFTLAGGLTFASISFAQSYEMVLICSIINGFTTGISGVLIAVLFMQFLGTKNFGMGLTIASVLGGILMLMSGSFIGVLKDNMGTYRVSFFIIGSFQGCSAIIWFLYELCCCCRRK